MVATSSQSYELTPLVWVGLGIASVAWFVDALTDQKAMEMLATREGEKPVIIRSQNQTHRFPLLGVEVPLLPGWSYLAVREDQLAYRPAFVHAASGSLIRLQANVFDEWPPKGLADRSVMGKHPKGELEWVRDKHVQVGRLQFPSHRLIAVAIQHDSKGGVNTAIEEFCAGIRQIDSRD